MRNLIAGIRDSIKTAAVMGDIVGKLPKYPKMAIPSPEQELRDTIRRKDHAIALYEMLTVARLNPPESIMDTGERMPNDSERRWIKKLGDKERALVIKICRFRRFHMDAEGWMGALQQEAA